MGTSQRPTPSTPPNRKKETYEPPRMELIQLQPEEALLTCGKLITPCPTLLIS